MSIFVLSCCSQSDDLHPSGSLWGPYRRLHGCSALDGIMITGVHALKTQSWFKRTGRVGDGCCKLKVPAELWGRDGTNVKIICILNSFPISSTSWKQVSLQLFKLVSGPSCLYSSAHTCQDNLSFPVTGHQTKKSDSVFYGKPFFCLFCCHFLFIFPLHVYNIMFKIFVKPISLSFRFYLERNALLMLFE